MTSITRKFSFDAGHRIWGHESKCKYLHGHTYTAEVTVMGPALDPLGRVVDFSVLKSVIGNWLERNWDHQMILHEADGLLDLAPGSEIWQGRSPFIMPRGMNPTAENLAQVLHDYTQPLLPKHIHITNVRVHETPNCFADYTPGDAPE